MRSTHSVFPSPNTVPTAAGIPSQEDETSVTYETALRTAAGIASRLVADAVWYEGMCNWMGTDLKVEAKGASAGSRREEWAALGPDLYTGTAGVGLFLAEYAAVAGERDARKTALAAFHHAFNRADFLPPVARPGLYTGWVGIALAAARSGYVLAEAELTERASDLMRRCTLETHHRHEHDLLAGSAGAIVGCLALHALTGQNYLLDYAVRMGEDLLSAGLHARNGAICWKGVNNKTAAPLTGFSHGTAGIAYALLELWQLTSDAALSRSRPGCVPLRRATLQPFDQQLARFSHDRANALQQRHARRSTIRYILVPRRARHRSFAPPRPCAHRRSDLPGGSSNSPQNN